MTHPGTALRWLEVTMDFRCNQRCHGCFAAQEGGPSMDGREALAALARGRREGARWLWLGGGEPTLRRDLFALASAARRMGYERVKLQTNGMLLSYPDFARRCADAGVTEVAFAVKGATAETHDRWTRTPGAHALMVHGMEAARALGMDLEADVLVYRQTAGELPAIVRRYTPLGVGQYRIWLLSAVDVKVPEVAAEVPRMADVVPYITAAMDLGLSQRPDFIVSLHTPPCTLPRTHHGALFHAPDLGMLVANPGGHAFRLEESPMEGGHHVPACDGCPDRARCTGPRADYLALHGGDEFYPRGG